MLIAGYVSISAPAVKQLAALGITPSRDGNGRGFDTFEIPDNIAGNFDYVSGTVYQPSKLFLADDPDWPLKTLPCGHTSRTAWLCCPCGYDLR